MRSPMKLVGKGMKAVVRWMSAWAWEHEEAVCNGMAALKGMNMDEKTLEFRIQQDPAVAQWVAACFASLLAEAPNYNEMRFELMGKYKGKYEWITVTVLKGSGKTPHQLRQEAEKERDELRAKLGALQEKHDEPSKAEPDRVPPVQ